MSTRPHDKANELFEAVRVISQLLQLDNSEVAGLALELAKSGRTGTLRSTRFSPSAYWQGRAWKQKVGRRSS